MAAEIPDVRARAPAAGSRAIKSGTAIALLAGLSSSSLVCAPAIASQLATQMGLGAAQIGYFFSVEFAGFVASGLIGQWVMPRYDWRRVALVSLMCFLAGTLASVAAMDTYTLLLGVRFVTATSGALLGVVCMGSANEDANPSRAYGFYIIGQLLAGVVGLAVFPALFAQFGLTSFFVAVAVLSVLFAGATAWLASGKAKGTSDRSTVSGSRGPLALLRIPALLLVYTALGGIWTFMGDLGIQTGLDPVAAGKLLSAATFAGVIGAGVASLLGKSAGTRWPLLIGYGLLIASPMMLLADKSLASYVTAIMAFKFAWTFALPFLLAIIGELDRDGRIVAEIYLTAGIGLMLGPSLAGWLVSSAHGFPGMLFVETALLVISAISIYGLRRHVSS